MFAISWDEPDKRLYESGIDRGVLYPAMGPGVPWSGLISIDENSVGGESTPLYYDGVKYLDVMGNEDFQASLTALSAPEEFNICDGIRPVAPGLFVTQQPRVTFGLSYRTLIGKGANPRYGYKIHLVYHATANPSPFSSKTLSDTVEPSNRTWVIDTVPGDRGDLLIKPTAHLVIDSTKSNPEALAAVESILYGTESEPAQLLSQTAFASALSDLP